MNLAEKLLELQLAIEEEERRAREIANGPGQQAALEALKKTFEIADTLDIDTIALLNKWKATNPFAQLEVETKNIFPQYH